MKNIVFTLENEYYDGWAIEPAPAIEELPEWYKNSKATVPFVSGNAREAVTVKRCVPFLDALSFGYIIRLNADIYIDIKQKVSTQVLNFRTEKPMIELHEVEQLAEYSIPDGYHKQPLKWVNSYNVKTPPGYSCLFTHPLNRTDLPFYVLSGVVDTDKFEMNVNFPFFLRDDFDGLIKRGTPIAQVIPFKRDDWKMEMGETRVNSEKFSRKYLAYFANAYKKVDWQRKSYR